VTNNQWVKPYTLEDYDYDFAAGSDRPAELVNIGEFGGCLEAVIDILVARAVGIMSDGYGREATASHLRALAERYASQGIVEPFTPPEAWPGKLPRPSLKVVAP
jgi:hypothetical protein